MFARLILLIAVLLMPFGMTPAAADSGDHHATMHMPAGHCPDQDSSGAGKAGIAACTMACSGALPASEAFGAEDISLRREIVVTALIAPLCGLHPDTATPPPKRS